MTVYHVQAIGKRLIQSVERCKSSSNQPRENTSPKEIIPFGDYQTQFSRNVLPNIPVHPEHWKSYWQSNLKLF